MCAEVEHAQPDDDRGRRATMPTPTLVGRPAHRRWTSTATAAAAVIAASVEGIVHPRACTSGSWGRGRVTTSVLEHHEATMTKATSAAATVAPVSR